MRAQLAAGHDVVEPLRLRRDPDHVEQRDRAVARQRRAEVLHLVRGRHAVEPDERRHLPVVAGEPPDDAAERAPVVQFPRREADLHQQRGKPMLVEMKAVARRAAGQARAQRRRPALEVRARRRRCCSRSPRRCRHRRNARRAPAA